MRRFRLAADGPLFLLSALGTAFLAGLVVFVARVSLPYDPFVACQTVAATVMARASTVATLLPMGLTAVIALASGLALGHQLWVTGRVLSPVLSRRQALSPRLARLAREAGIAKRLDVVAEQAVYTFCYGLRNPRVCVTTGLVRQLTDDELLAVLRHEAHHLHHGDPLKILLSRSMASGLFFVPLAGALLNSFLTGKEICADADAAPGGDDLSLARAMIKLLRAECPSWPAGVLAVGSFSPTDARLQRLIAPSTARPALPTAADWIVSIALVAGIFGFSYGAAAASRGEPVFTACATAFNNETTAVAGSGHDDPSPHVREFDIAEVGPCPPRLIICQ